MTALGAAALALLAAQPDGGVAFKWELPPGAFAPTEAAGEVESAGIATRLSTLWVNGDCASVGRFYAESFARAGLYVAPGQHAERAVTGYDAVNERSYSAVVHEAKKGKVRVLLGEANLGARRPSAPSEVGPVMPGAVDALVTRDEGSAHVSYRITATAAEVDAFYRAVFAKGFVEVAPGVFEGPSRYVVRRVKDEHGPGTAVRLERRAAEAQGTAR